MPAIYETVIYMLCSKKLTLFTSIFKIVYESYLDLVKPQLFLTYMTITFLEMMMQKLTVPWGIERRTVVKVEGENDSSFGCKPDKRTIDDHFRFGVINLDKTAGPSSHEVTAWVKRVLSVRKAGHGGTLET